jgi:3-hydroxyisobutyrate dehydrogenase-like beta-hydroxyacid dehydrogenase
LTFLVGGDAVVARHVQPILQTMAERVVHVGEIGAGLVAKIVHNGLLWAQVAAVGEMLELAQREGVSLDQVRGALRGTPGDNRPLQRWEDFARNPWALKDLAATVAIASNCAADLPLTELVYKLFSEQTVRLPSPPSG